MQHSLGFARNGRFAVVRSGTCTSIVPIAAAAASTVLPGAAGPFAWVGAAVWWTNRDGQLIRTSNDGSGGAIELAELETIEQILGVTDTTALVVDHRGAARLVIADGDRFTCKPVEGRGRWLAADPSFAVVTGDRGCELRTLGRARVVKLPIHGEALRASIVFGGRGVAVWSRQADIDLIVVATTSGQLLHTLPLETRLRDCAFAEQASLAIAAGETELTTIDLRIARVRRRVAATAVIEALDVDASGRGVVVALGAGDVRFMTTDELFVQPVPAVEVPLPVPAVELPDVEEPAVAPDVTPEIVPPPPTPPRRPTVIAVAARPSGEASAHLAALCDVVAARAQSAITQTSPEAGPSSIDDETLVACADALELLTHDMLGNGATPAFVAICRELKLSPMASQLLACAAAPRLRGKVARLYATLSRLSGQSVCSDHFLALLLEPDPGSDLADSIARELAAEAPLVRSSAIMLSHVGADRIITVDEVILDRLRAVERVVEITEATRRRSADRSLEDILAPEAAKQELVLAFDEPDRLASARVLVRGRKGSGRHTLVAAVAALVGRTVAAVDVKQLPGGTALPAALATELSRANLAGAIPVVSGLESLDHEPVRAQLQHVLSRHSGPVVVRTTLDADVAFDPDRVEIALPALDLGQRVMAWQRAIARSGLTFSADAIELLGTRYRFGPGTIERIVDQVARRAVRTNLAPALLLEQVARQHVTGRLEAVATRVTRLATWDHVTLPDEMRDSVLEFVGRMRCQRKVYEQWGFEQRIGTARGLTALFYGPPGTGKTLVAGLIGRELGLDVWRIDLARVMSKWVGETQKKLAEVFDAAEEGQVMLLFDEADSLFAKRKSDPKSSNDQYANMDTNYLLQRLDSFEGVAVMTTNLEGAIDPAFKRRLTMRLYFPFPDAEARARLWSAHVPTDVPREGALDFDDLGETFPISGGYIRNCALRAAFLAAQERRPLTQGHLLRALQLEYRELGKLWPSGRME